MFKWYHFYPLTEDQTRTRRLARSSLINAPSLLHEWLLNKLILWFIILPFLFDNSIDHDSQRTEYV